MPSRFWSLACQSAVFIQNKIFTKSRKAENKIQYRSWYGQDANRDYLRTFGCLSYIHNLKEVRKNKIVNTHDVVFKEEVFPKKGEVHEDPFNYETIKEKGPITGQILPPEMPKTPQPPQRSARIQAIMENTYSANEIISMNVTSSNPKFKPQRFKDIEQSPVKLFWTCACVTKIKNMEDKGLYELNFKPLDKKLIKEGEDYTKTFSPTWKPTSLQLIIAMAAKFKWKIEPMDVVAAFLNGDLDKEIYLDQPEGFNNGSGRFWKLKKSIYGVVFQTWQNNFLVFS
ncbi:hypothetical protein PCANC_27543 [Puccinia coronata f. sp. avenae]|uniref:Reverse transcriptase Ty1/copia-type domain-containing protein n=1 Tax=Puccinia coronata f. sp. avenae TaxID=200324 RepID=A0A2N5SAL5_9BASI|nr:hypothetical protein PCANC_27543 [Puccinia coronata f. sp. avenae]